MHKMTKLKLGQVVKIKSKDEIEAWASGYDDVIGGFVNNSGFFVFFPVERMYLCGMKGTVCGIESKFDTTLYTLEVDGTRISNMYFIHDWLEKVDE